MESQIIGKKILREKSLKNMLTNEFFKFKIMGRFKKIEMKEIRPVKNTWYDWLINYISEPIRKSVDGFKGKIVSFF